MNMKVCFVFAILPLILLLSVAEARTWKDGEKGIKIKWAYDCDFPGHDLRSVKIDVDDNKCGKECANPCGQRCIDHGECNSFTQVKGICKLKKIPSDQGSSDLTNENAYCGYLPAYFNEK